MNLLPREIAHQIVGLPVSHSWIGYGSALLVELGDLDQRIKRDGSEGNPSGEVTLMIEWSWRIEKPRSILGGSWSSNLSWPSMTKKLVGSNVVAVETFGVLPELLMSLSNGLRVASFMTEKGQPEWALLMRKANKSVSVKRGKLFYEVTQ